MKPIEPDAPASLETETESGAWSRRAGGTVKWLLGVASLAILITGSVFWGMESWMLPEALWRTGEWIWVMIASAGGLGFAGFMISLDSSRHRMRQAMIALVVILSMTGGMRWVGRELALSRLLNSEELQGTSSSTPESISQWLVKWMEDKHLSIPSWLKKHASYQTALSDPPRMHRLVSYSRWPVRHEFVMRMMKNEKHAAYLVENWDECFPAVTGADVDLAHRRDLMEMFRTMHGNPSLSKQSRHAATLWMALVFLTDPVEFTSCREPIRDAMLGVSDPILAEHHDCWMRVLDTLLAHDPPASWPMATQALTSNPTTLRRAVRERVRGVMSHFDAIVREFDSSQHAADWNAAFALWQDTGRWLIAHPNTAEEARVRQWRGATMFRWLESDGLGTTWGKLFDNNETLVNLTPEDVVDLTPEQEAVLYAKACDWAGQAVSRSEKATAISDCEEAHAALEHVRVLLPFLAGEHQKDLVRRMTPALIRPGIYVTLFNHNKKLPEYRSCVRCRKLIERSWHQLAPDDLKALVKNMRPLWTPRHTGAWLLCFDAWSDNPEFSDEEWLVHALAEDRIWRSMPADTPRNLVEIVPYTRIPVPPVKNEVAAKVIAKLHAAIWKSEGQMFLKDEILSNLQALYPDRPLSPATVKGLHYRLLNMRAMFRNKDSRDFATIMRMELNLSGLTEIDEALMAAFAQQARDDRRLHYYLMPWHPDPWRVVLNSPTAARQCLLNLIGRDDDRHLQGLLSSAVRTPPADDVARTMWQELRMRSDTAEPREKPRIHGALFHLAPLVSEKERLSMRRDFLEYFRKTPLPINKWPNQAIEDIWKTTNRFGKGEGIPWEDDSLSAALSWSSEVGRQVDLTPEYPEAEKSTGVFSYLAQAMVSYTDEGLGGIWLNENPVYLPVPITVWKLHPLRPPFEPTPWQQARDLHLRRPDLHFPDPAWARPGRCNF